MRIQISTAALGALALVAAACGEPTTTTGGTGTVITEVTLKVKTVTPPAIFVEGGDLITIATENGCKKEAMSIEVDGVAVQGIQSDALNSYTFTAPPAKTTASKTVVTIDVKCSAHPDPAKNKYAAGGAAKGSLTYDPDLEPNPTVKTPSPVGPNMSVLSRMVVTFTRYIDETTVNAASFSITGQSGAIVPSDGDATKGYKTFTFTPSKQLDYDAKYTCKVTTAVKSKFAGKPLRPTQAPTGGTVNADFDAWEFHTRCEGCGNPWLGAISAAAGISEGGGYKLFSVTGEPSAVGESTNDQYHLQAGFIYATQPAP